MSEEQVFAQFVKNFNDYGQGKLDRKVLFIKLLLRNGMIIMLQ